MLREETLNKIKTLRLSGFAEALCEQYQTLGIEDLSFDERLGLLIDREIAKRSSNKITRLLSLAKFQNQEACIENIDYTIPRNLRRDEIVKLATCDYIKHARNINIFGATGAGKSYLGQALGHAACLNGIATRYFQLPELLDQFKLAESRGIEYIQKLNKQLVKVPLLILDEWLLFKIDEDNSRHLLSLIDRRYNKTSTIIISQFSPDEWIEQIPLQVAAEAITDRLTSNAHTITLESKESMRKLEF